MNLEPTKIPHNVEVGENVQCEILSPIISSMVLYKTFCKAPELNNLAKRTGPWANKQKSKQAWKIMNQGFAIKKKNISVHY